MISGRFIKHAVDPKKSLEKTEIKSGQEILDDAQVQRARDRKEKVFVSTRVATWERYCKDIKQTIAKKMIYIEYSDPKPSNVDKLEYELNHVFKEIVLPRIEDELNKLKKLVAAQDKLEKRKEEFAERVEKLVEERERILKELVKPQKDRLTLEADKSRLEHEISRLKNPPTIDGMLEYFSRPNIYKNIESYLTAGKSATHQPIVDAVLAAIRNAINDDDNKFYLDFLSLVRQWLAKSTSPGQADPGWIVQWINNQSTRFQDAQKKLDRNIDALESGLYP